jgi:alginate O-acetyltransferase complex protein AlgI
MIFTTWLYALFFVVMTATYWLLPVRARPPWLIAGGLVFYANYFPAHLALIVIMTAGVYGAALIATRSRVPGTWVLAAGIVGCLAVLGYYKYTEMVLHTFGQIGLRLDFTLVPIRAPLAISFFVFEYVHYLIELRRGRIRPGRPQDFFLFILFFPTLICGPIKRFYDFAPQLSVPRRFSGIETSAGLERIVIGLGKKLIIADTVRRLIAPIWAHPLAATRGTLWLATYGYALEIFFDFSGYSDIAIGSAQVLGFRVPENFNYPYLQPNIALFWRSWHMSLTSWITDYVYVPLGGNRHGGARAQLNRLLSMALCGLWHGAAWHFVLWGLYHGIGLNCFRLYERLKPRWRTVRPAGVAGRAVATIVTFHFVCIGWVLFVLDAKTASAVIARLVGIA